MNKKKWFTWFASSVGVFLTWEFIAIFDGNEDTYTLTSAVINYVPEWLFWSLTLPFFAWFIHHFYIYYKQIKK